MATKQKTKPRTKPDCLNGYGDGPTHCTLEVGHKGPCNHLTASTEESP